MTVSLRDARHSPEGRRWIEGVFPEYLDALTSVSMNTGIFPIMGEFGNREPDMLARWFGDDACFPLMILQDNQPVGFAVVSKPLASQRAVLDFRMAEFFVSKSKRRLGIGRQAVELIFRRFAGRWEITETQSNRDAVVFWRSVLNRVAPNQFKERLENGEVKQYFDSRRMSGHGSDKPVMGGTSS